MIDENYKNIEKLIKKCGEDKGLEVWSLYKWVKRYFLSLDKSRLSDEEIMKCHPSSVYRLTRIILIERGYISHYSQKTHNI